MLVVRVELYIIRRLNWLGDLGLIKTTLLPTQKACQSLIMFNCNVDLTHSMKMPLMETKLNIIVCPFVSIEFML